MDTQVTAIARGDATRADAPKLTAPKSSAPAWKAIAPIAIAVVLALAPAPPGLPHHAWYFFSIFVGVIVGLVLEPLPGAAIAIIGITVVAVLAPFVLFSPQQLSAPGFRPPSAALNWALSGYSNPTVWLIFGAFILALGYERTGLGERIALLLVKRMGKNSLLLGYGVTLADTILAPFIPSPTARSGGIIYPIISDLAPIYGSKPNDVSARRIGSYLMWVAIATTCVTSSLFLTAGSFNLLAVGLVEKLTKTDLGWTDWFSTAAPATIIPLLILIPLLTYWLYAPEVKHSTEVSQWAASRLEKLGRLTTREHILAAIVVVALFLWVVGGAFINATTVAFVAVSLMLITRVVTWADIVADKRAWKLSPGLVRSCPLRWTQPRRLSSGSPMASPREWGFPGDGYPAVVFFVAHYLFASVDAYTTALLPVILLTGASNPEIPVKEFALLLCLELGIMGIITPFG